MRFSLIIILILLFSCGKKEDFRQIAVIGHAGMGLERQNSVYHDNSREAVELAMSIQGCDGVEIDVQLSSDGEIWLYHDTELSSTTNSSGCVPDRNADYLGGVRYSTFHKEKLVRLSDLNLTLFRNKMVFLDVRHLNECSSEFVDASMIIDVILATGITSVDGIQLYCILSFSGWIDAFTAAGFKTLYSSTGGSDHLSWINNYPAIDGLVVKNSEVTGEQVDQIHSQDKKVFIFEMRSPKGIRKALRKYPDGVITDDIRATLIEKY
jgi:glycerophosphoryl diester phosphodiesterase